MIVVASWHYLGSGYQSTGEAWLAASAAARAREERRIAYVKVGRHVRLAPGDVEAFIAARRIEVRPSSLAALPTDTPALAALPRFPVGG